MLEKSNFTCQKKKKKRTKCKMSHFEEADLAEQTRSAALAALLRLLPPPRLKNNSWMYRIQDSDSEG